MLVGMSENGTCDRPGRLAGPGEIREGDGLAPSSRSVEEVSLFLHRYYLRGFLRPGMSVLELGACEGMFTPIMAEAGCRVVVADVSLVGLERHRQQAVALAFDHAVEARVHLDGVGRRSLAGKRFDTVVCFGGLFFEILEHAPPVLGGLSRACRSGGYLLLSAMSLWGAVHKYLGGLPELPPTGGRQPSAASGPNPGSWTEFQLHRPMFRADELRRLAEDGGWEVVAMSASNALSIGWNGFLLGAEGDPGLWNELLRLELNACREESCLDMGAHIILVGRKA